MRNRNIFIRKPTAMQTGGPVFAHVTDYVDGDVYYEVDYPVQTKKGHFWHYSDRTHRYSGEAMSSGTYIKPLEDFLTVFAPDYENEYSRFA